MSQLRITAFSEAQPQQAFVETFCEAAQRLRQDPYRVGLLPPEADALFLMMPLPAPREFWLVERDGLVVGRIGASVSTTDPKRGTVGFFEVEPEDADAAAELLSTAEAWLREQGVRTVYGPVNINTWFPYRFRVGGTDDLSYSWEPVNPPAYPQHFLQAGFETDRDYHSDRLDNFAEVYKQYKSTFEKTLDAGYTYRPVDTGDGLDAEIPTLYRLSVAGFANNYLFDPIPESVFRMLYVAQARKRRALGCHFVSHPDHGEVGFIIGFEDEANQFVVKSMVVLPEHQSKGLSFALARLAFGSAMERGHDALVGALLQTGNRSEASCRRTSLAWQHEYVLYRKTIA